MEQEEMFEAQFLRPNNFEYLTEEHKLSIDKHLGIQDWDGRCPHQKSYPCNACEIRIDDFYLK